MAAVSDKLGESFQQDISQTKNLYCENVAQLFLLIANGDVRDAPNDEYERQSYDVID